MSKKQIKYIKVSALTLVIVIALGAFQMFRFQKESEARFASREKQTQILINNWEAEGLSQEEIQEKLQEQRGRNFERGDINPAQRVMFMVRRATGGGPPRGGRPPGGFSR